MKQSFLYCLAAWFLLFPEFSSPRFLFAENTPASAGTLLFSFVAGCEQNSIRLRPVGKQRFETITVDSHPCLRLLPDKSEGNRNWYFVLEGPRWQSPFVDAELTVDQIATETELRWLVYDSGFHEYHQFPNPPFALERGIDRTLFQLPTRRSGLPGNMIRTVYQIRKARFSRRSDHETDFNLHSDRNLFTGLHRLTLRVRPATRRAHAQPILLPRLLEQFFQTLLQRPIAPWECKRYEQAYQNQEIWLFPLVQKLFYHPEFLEKNFHSYERVDAVKQLFQLACGREPTGFELNSYAALMKHDGMDFAARVFVETYYTEIVERVVGSLTPAPE